MSYVLKEEQAIFVGDCVLGAGSTVFTDLHSYMASLEALSKRKDVTECFHSMPWSKLAATPVKPEALYCGHGPFVEPGQGHRKVEEYYRHRKEREDQVFNVLKEVRLLLCLRTYRCQCLLAYVAVAQPPCCLGDCPGNL